jgi:hypothetical protein
MKLVRLTVPNVGVIADGDYALVARRAGRPLDVVRFLRRGGRSTMNLGRGAHRALAGAVAFILAGAVGCRSGEAQSQGPGHGDTLSDHATPAGSIASDVPAGHVRYSDKGRTRLVPIAELDPEERAIVSRQAGTREPVVDIEVTSRCVTAETVCCAGDTLFYGPGHVQVFDIHADCFPGH